jgi:hypothetical protein
MYTQRKMFASRSAKCAVACFLLLGIFCGFVCHPSEFAQARQLSPRGAWNLTLTIEPPEGPPVTGISHMTFNAGGTLAETSGVTHYSSATPENPFNASEGRGEWRRIHSHVFGYTFLKLLYDIDGVHVGYVKVSGTLTIDPANRDRFTGENFSQLLFGTDLDTALVTPFGPGTYEGERISVDL